MPFLAHKQLEIAGHLFCSCSSGLLGHPEVIEASRDNAKSDRNALHELFPGGVKAAQRSLEPLVLVRIQAGELWRIVSPQVHSC